MFVDDCLMDSLARSLNALHVDQSAYFWEVLVTQIVSLDDGVVLVPVFPMEMAFEQRSRCNSPIESLQQSIEHQRLQGHSLRH